MTIYNRWGGSDIFTPPTSISIGTDSWINGKLAPIGNYVYHVAVKDRYDAVTDLHGTVKLIR